MPDANRPPAALVARHFLTRQVGALIAQVEVHHPEVKDSPWLQELKAFLDPKLTSQPVLSAAQARAALGLLMVKAITGSIYDPFPPYEGEEGQREFCEDVELRLGIDLAPHWDALLAEAARAEAAVAESTPSPPVTSSPSPSHGGPPSSPSPSPAVSPSPPQPPQSPSPAEPSERPSPSADSASRAPQEPPRG